MRVVAKFALHLTRKQWTAAETNLKERFTLAATPRAPKPFVKMLSLAGCVGEAFGLLTRGKPTTSCQMTQTLFWPLLTAHVTLNEL